MTSQAARARMIGYVTVGVAGLALALSGYKVELTSARVALGAVSAVPLVMNLHDRFLWRVPWLPAGQPDLRGLWEAEIRSMFGDSAAAGAVRGYVVIRQTALTLTALLYTPESSSTSTTASVQRTPDGRCEVSWIYRSESRHELRSLNPMHHGGVRIDAFSGRRPTRLQGKYFTDRGTGGDLVLARKALKYPDSYTIAASLVDA